MAKKREPELGEWVKSRGGAYGFIVEEVGSPAGRIHLEEEWQAIAIVIAGNERLARRKARKRAR